MGLTVYEGKTKYRLSKFGVLIPKTTDNYTFDTVKGFIYLGSADTNKDNVSMEIKHRITLANRRYYGLNGQLNNRIFPCTNSNTIEDAYPKRASLWRRGMNPIKH